MNRHMRHSVQDNLETSKSGQKPERKLAEALLDAMRDIVGKDNVLESGTETLVYECDGMMTHRYPPSAVVLPNTTDQVAPIVRLLAEHAIPFVARDRKSTRLNSSH